MQDEQDVLDVQGVPSPDSFVVMCLMSLVSLLDPFLARALSVTMPIVSDAGRRR